MRLYIRDTENYVDVNYYEDLCTEAATVVHRADYAEAEDEDGCTCYIVSADTAEYWSNVENMQYQLDNIKSDLAEAISAPDELAEIYDDINEAISDRDLDDGLMAGLNTAKAALKKPLRATIKHIQFISGPDGPLLYIPEAAPAVRPPAYSYFCKKIRDFSCNTTYSIDLVNTK